MLLKTLDTLGISKELNTHTYFEGTEEKPVKKTMPFFDEDQERNLLINYFRPNGTPIMFIPKGGTKAQRYFRKRWVNPTTDNKYHSPKGSSAQVFFPPQILEAFKKKEQIETLFVTEGEKKAFKGCNDGLMTVGSSGLYGFKSENRKNFHPDLIRVIEECRVKNLVLLHDADAMTVNWSKGKNLFKRPFQFFCSVRDFVKVSKTHPIDVYYSHISTEYDGDGKGLDDLLITYSAQKTAIVENALKLETGKWFQFLDLRKTSTDKIQTYFGVNNSPQNFYQIYKTHIGQNPFVLGNFEYEPQEDGKVKRTENDQPFTFWKTVKFKGDERAVILREPLIDFYESKGFMNVMMPTKNNKLNWFTVRKDGNIIEDVESLENVLGQMVRKKLKGVNSQAWEAWLGAGERLVNPKWLQMMLHTEKANLLRDTENKSYLLFENGMVKVTPDDYDIVPYEELQNQLIWKSHLNENQFTKVTDLRQCEFFQFLLYAISCKKGDDSNYTALIDLFEDGLLDAYDSFKILKENSDKTGEDTEETEALQKILSACSIYGYMLSTFRTSGGAYAVQCVDATIETDLRKHEGRRGKSLFAKSLYQWGLRVGNSVSNDDFRRTLNYTFGDEWIDPDAQILHYKDIEHGYDISLNLWKTKITDGYSIRKKKAGIIDIPFEHSAKIIIDTNHALNGEGGSINARFITVEFGDFFNPEHDPVKQFGHMMYDEWEWEEKNRFHNFAAMCLQLYQVVFKEHKTGIKDKKAIHNGIIPFPAKQHEMRKLLIHCKPFAKEFFDNMITTHQSGEDKAIIEKPLLYVYDDKLDEEGKIPYDYRENAVKEDGTLLGYEDDAQTMKYCLSYNYLIEKCIDLHPQEIIETLSDKKTPASATARDLLSFKRFKSMLTEWATFNGITINPGYTRNRCQRREQNVRKECIMLYKPKKAL